MQTSKTDAVEQALLGAVLADSELMRTVATKLHPNDFEIPEHRRVWEAMLALSNSGRTVDHPMVAEELARHGALGAVGGVAFLFKLDEAAPALPNVVDYAQAIAQRSQLRKLARFGERLSEMARELNADPNEIRARAMRGLLSVVRETNVKTLDVVNRRVYEHIAAVQDGRIEPVIPTGLDAMDKLIGGLQTELILFGAKSSVGKSAFVATLVQNLARAGRRVAFFSLEDRDEWLSYRYIAHSSGVNQFVLRFRQLSAAQAERVGASGEDLAKFEKNVHVDDSENMTAAEICARADHLVLNEGCEVVIIDHLQEVDHSANRMEQHHLNVRRSVQLFRDTVKRLKVPVVLMAQLNEDAEGDPSLGHFQDSKFIGKMARVTGVLTRKPDSDTMRIHFLKQTNGKQGKAIDIQFIRPSAMVGNHPDAQPDPYEPASATRTVRMWNEPADD